MASSGAVNVRMGRPPKPPTERQSETINVSLTAEVADMLHRSALRARLTTSAFVREQIIAHVLPHLPDGRFPKE